MNEAKQLFDALYSVVKIGGIFFAIGIAWQLLKTLRENLVELKASHMTLTALVASHETRITVLETVKSPRRKK